MNRDAIGVFDSGMGGLTAVKVLNQIMPHENIIYFGDTARIPYGTRSRQTIQRYTQEDVAFLRQPSGKNDHRRMRHGQLHAGNGFPRG